MGSVFEGIVNVVKSVVGGVIDTVKAIIKNPLPAIASLALSYFAPGWGGALAKGLGFTTKAAAGIATTAIKAVGGAAITALNGGDMKSILTAGLMPVVMSPAIQKALLGTAITGAGGILTNNPIVQGIVNNPIVQGIDNILGNSGIANIIKSAAGSATIGGAIALVTGEDIKKAALGAGVGSISSAIVGNKFDSNQKAVITSDKLAADYKNVQTQAQQLLSKDPNLQRIAAVQKLQYTEAQGINKEIDEYKK
jgi:hypothetical protein